jgi:ParB/RepB/Spo0J family partition protein
MTDDTTKLFDVQLIPIEDVRPDPEQPRKEMRNIDELAESIRRFGQLTPILVRQDGGTFHIIGGERRWTAMKASEETLIAARVATTDEEEDVLIELADNQHDPLTDEERMHGAQRAFKFGLETDDIAVASGFATDQLAKTRRVLKKLNDDTAAEDVSLDQAVAAYEFLDDDKAFGEIMNAGANWQQVARSIAVERKAAVALEAARAFLAEAGIAVIEKQDPAAHKYINGGNFAGADTQVPKDAKCARLETYGSQAWLMWYRDAGAQHDPEADAEREAAEKARVEFDANMQAAKDARYGFFCDLLSLAIPPAMAKVVATVIRTEDWIQLDWEEVAAILGIEEVSDVTVCENASRVIWGALVEYADTDAHNSIYGPSSLTDRDEAEVYARWMNALTAAGYQPTEFEAELLDIASKALADDEGGEG